MENRLKECQGDLFADRTPTPTMRANQLRLWLSSMAYVLLCAIRRIGLAGTKLERATCGTIRDAENGPAAPPNGAASSSMCSPS